MRYYLKKCGHQELGSITNGGPKRGRYLLTSMSALDFFPPLSETQLNDSALLPIIPLYSGKKVYCTYVYHNDKFHGSTAANPRNEYRLYLNQKLENGKLLFQVDDIVVIRTDQIHDSEACQQVWILDLVHDHTSFLYEKLNRVIANSPIQGNYGVYEGRIDEFEQRFASSLVNQQSEVAIDDTVTSAIADSEDMASLFNPSSFRDFVMFGYESLCAVSGTVIRCDNFMNLEAAHIKPESHGGLLIPNNGIAMSRDIHWAFDKGFFTLNDNFEVVVHPDITSDYLRSFEGSKIRFPEYPFFHPGLDNIHYHRNNVYGLFLTSGRL